MNSSPTSTVDSVPALSPAEVRRLVLDELSVRPRVGYTLLLLAALAMSVITASLWLTEPGLPARTRLAMMAMTGIGLCWSAFFGWVLTRRRIRLASHRVVAGRLAVTFSALFTAAATTLAFLEPAQRDAGLFAAAAGVVMTAAAVALLLEAGRRQRSLLRLRSALEALS